MAATPTSKPILQAIVPRIAVGNAEQTRTFYERIGFALRPPVSWAPAHYRLCRCNHKAGAWKMHANLADLTIIASDHDLMDVRGDQFTDNRVASSIVGRDGNGLARFPTDGILRIDGRPSDRCGIPCYI